MRLQSAAEGVASDGPLIYIDRSDIRPGGIDELRLAVSDLVEFIEEREPRLLSYAFHIDPQRSTMAVVAVHPDRASLQLHLDIGGTRFRKVGEYIELRRIEVYGDPGPTIVDMLEQKARMLGRDAHVVVLPRSVGFERFGAAGSARASHDAASNEPRVNA
jgi:hypothetical protein